MKRKTIALIILCVGMLTMLFCIFLLFNSTIAEEFMLAITCFLLSGVVTMLAISDYQLAKKIDENIW